MCIHIICMYILHDNIICVICIIIFVIMNIIYYDSVHTNKQMNMQCSIYTYTCDWIDWEVQEWRQLNSVYESYDIIFLDVVWLLYVWYVIYTYPTMWYFQTAGFTIVCLNPGWKLPCLQIITGLSSSAGWSTAAEWTGTKGPKHVGKIFGIWLSIWTVKLKMIQVSL